MFKIRLLLFALGASLFLLSAGNTQEKTQSTSSGKTTTRHSASGGGFNVCQGTFANCTEAACEPVYSNGQIKSFSCKCKVESGYSLGINGPGNRNSCQAIPQDPPSAGQKVPSRYAPIKNAVVCTNKRPWALCIDAPCIVDHVDEKDPSKGAATCACPKATGGPYGYIPPDGQYSRSGCEDKYISSATIDNALQITQFLTTPAGKNLRPYPITILVPTPVP